MYRTPNIPRRLAIIGAVTLIFMAALGGFLFWYLGGQESAAKEQANKFIGALEANRPGDAPENGDDYVRGVWKTFRRVDSVELLKTRQKSFRHRNTTGGYSYWVADMLLHSGRGLAVLELSFEPNHIDPKEQVIDQLYELTPDRIPGDTLDARTLARVKSDLGERGDAANDFTLSTSGDSSFPSDANQPSAPKPSKPVKPPKYKQPPIIRCIRRAHGDVAKIQKCSRLANQ